jgi:cobalt-precorrin-5B (C1)-methyltransferase
VGELAEQFSSSRSVRFCVKVSVPKGVELAKKTLNKRLGIVGGISILGTTGIVRPVSADAWTATITAAMDVAEAAGNTEIVLSTGRTSEAALERTGNFHDEALIMMGDYLEFALQEAGNHSFNKIHVAGMWAKILKAAMRVPQTHVRYGMLAAEEATAFIQSLQHGKEVTYLEGVNTAREIYERLMERNDVDVVHAVCIAAKEYHQEISGLPADVYLVHPSGKIVMTN